MKCIYKNTLKWMRNHLKGEFLIQIEVTFLLIIIEIPGLWHFKANAVLFPNMIKIQLVGGMAPPNWNFITFGKSTALALKCHKPGISIIISKKVTSIWIRNSPLRWFLINFKVLFCKHISLSLIILSGFYKEFLK